MHFDFAVFLLCLRAHISFIQTVIIYFGSVVGGCLESRQALVFPTPYTMGKEPGLGWPLRVSGREFSGLF